MLTRKVLFGVALILQLSTERIRVVCELPLRLYLTDICLSMIVNKVSKKEIKMSEVENKVKITISMESCDLDMLKSLASEKERA